MALGLAAGELALRSIRTGDPAPNRKALPPDLPKLEGLAALTEPHARGDFGGVLYESNRQGMRDRHHPIVRETQTYRIALVGDSFTMGDGVAVEDTYAHQLEERLAPHVEVLNLGVSGFDTRASVERFETVGVLFDPDLVVYGWTLNDLEGEGYRKTEAGTWDDQPETSWELGRLFANTWNAVRDRYFPGPDSLIHELRENYFRNPPVWERFTDQLDRLRRVADRAGVCGVVFLHPFLFHLEFGHPFHEFYDAAEAAAKARGLQTVRSIDRFLGRRSRPLWAAANDPHPNAEGHALLADALESGLDALPARCGYRPGQPRALAEARPGDGYTLIAPVGSDRVAWIDRDGRAVHELRLARKTDVVEQLPSGNLLTVGADGGLYEYDATGAEVWQRASVWGRFHGTVHRSSRGSTFAPLRRGARRSFWTENIVEFHRNGLVAWQWNALDHLDPDDRGPHERSFKGFRDWLHINSIDEFSDGDLLVSLRNLNRLIRIDYPSGDIVWQWGDDELGHQHGASVIAGDRVLLFDNGFDSARGKGCRDTPCRSRALELDPATDRTVWSYGRPRVFSLSFGNAERLANGNTLVVYGQKVPRALIVEVSPDGEVVWQTHSPIDAPVPSVFGPEPRAWVYRAQRVAWIPGRTLRYQDAPVPGTGANGVEP